MRVVEVISGLGLGGAERALVQRLRNAPPGVLTRVISTRPDLAALNSEVSQCADLVVLPSSGRFRFAGLCRAIDEFNADAVVVHNPLETVRLLAWPRFAHGHRVIPVAHSDRATFKPSLEPVLNFALKLLNPRAVRHIAVSKAAAVGRQCAGSRDTRVVHLGASLDSECIPVDAWPAGTVRRWVTIGRFVPPKNFEGLLRAVTLARSDLEAGGVHLLLVGYGELEGKLRQLRSNLGLESLVTIYGAVSDPSGLLRRADALLISSTHEGGPITAYEAELAGCRLVATPVGVCPEVAADDAESVLSSGSSDPELALVLAKAAKLIPLSDVHRTARSAAASHWDVRRTTKQFYAALAE